MTAALVEYGLFLAKSLTLVLLVGVLLIALIRGRGGFHGDGERIEVSDLNGKYREMARVLKRASLPKKAVAKALKEDRKARKRQAKTEKKDRRRLFVIDFLGDIKATEVAALRELITCVLMEAGEHDELHMAGEYKRTLTLFGENSDADRDKVREQLEDTHGLFKDFIREYRPDVDLGRVATGEYWHGIQAVELGLVDAVETSDDYLLNARDDAAIYLVAYAVHKRPLERLLSAMHSGLLRALSGRW